MKKTGLRKRQMKKIISILLILVLSASVLAGCGSNKEKIKEELRGTWSYDSYASFTNEHCHQVYEFHSDGTVDDSWIVDETPSKSSFKEAMYTIEKDYIAIIYLDGSKQAKIDYSFKNGELKLFDRGTDGSIEKELKKN